MLNAQRATAKSPQGIQDILSVLERHGAQVASLRDDPRLAEMKVPSITYRVDENEGVGHVAGNTFLLSTSLVNIGFVKTDSGFVLPFTADKTPAFVDYNLKALCTKRGWELRLD